MRKEASNPSKAAEDGSDDELLDDFAKKLSYSKEEVRVIHKCSSKMNGDILIEEVSSNKNEKIRRMRFTSNLHLEQTEVRLLKRVNDSASKKQGDTRQSQFVADHEYVPYDCLRGMLVSFALLPSLKIEELPSANMRILIVGLAGGMLPRFVHSQLKGASLDCVEIDEAVRDAAEEFLGLVTDEKLKVHVADGLDFVKESDDHTYNLSIIDVNACDEDTTLEAPPRPFVEDDFVRHLSRVTKKPGVAVVNVICSSSSLLQEIFDRFLRFFDDVLYLKDHSPDADENYVVLLLNGPSSQWNFNVGSESAIVDRVEQLEKIFVAMRQFGLTGRTRRELKRHVRLLSPSSLKET